MSSASASQGGELDNTYGRSGQATFDFDSDKIDIVRDTILQPDGKLLLAEGSKSGALGSVARLMPDGTLDPSFGQGGVTSIPDAAWDKVYLQADGKILLGGRVGSLAALARLNADGSVDSGFADHGFAKSDFRGIEPDSYDSDRRSHYNQDTPVVELAPQATIDISTLPDGSILTLAGVMVRHEDDEDIDQGYSVIQHLNADGSVIAGFGGADSKVVSEEPLGAHALFARPDGTFTVSGAGDLFDDDPFAGVQTVKYLANGKNDKAFSGNGSKFVISFYGDTDRIAAVEDDKGRILITVAGKVVRLLADGNIDRTFYGGNPAPEPMSGFLIPPSSDLKLRPDQGFEVAGTDDEKSGSYLFAVSADENGVRDTGFSGDGTARFRIGGRRKGEAYESPGRISINPDGSTFGAATATVGDHTVTKVLKIAPPEDKVRYCDGQRAKLVGTEGDDTIRGYGPIVTLGGNDVVTLLGGSVCTGSGDDQVILPGGRGSSARVFTGSGNDFVSASKREIVTEAHMGSGNDRARVDGNRDYIHGDGGADRIFAGNGEDRLFGGPGRDLIVGGNGGDNLLGGPGRDHLLGQAGNDWVFGGPGRDVVSGGPKAPVITSYFASRGKVKVEIRKVGSRLTRFRFTVPWTCNGFLGQTPTGSDASSTPIRINSAGKFSWKEGHNSNATDDSASYGASGKLGNGRITGSLFDEFDAQGAICSTKGKYFRTGVGTPRFQRVHG